MPGTFSQLYIQIVFAVKGRENLIAKSWQDEIHKYIARIIKAKEQKSIIVNGVADHVHRVTEYFPIHNLTSKAYTDTFKIKKSITKRKHSEKNTLNF